MLLYLIIFFIPVFFYLYSTNHKVHDASFLFWYVGGLCVFVGLGDMLGGYDRYIYGELFDITADELKAGVPFYQTVIFNQYPMEVGYDMINVLIGLFTRNRYIFIFILTTFIYSSLFLLMKRYVINAPFAMIVFMPLMFYFTFTYLRQLLAVSVVWYSIEYVYRRKFWKFAIITLIGILIHNGIALYFFFYFLPVKKYARNKVVMLMAALFVLGLLGGHNLVYTAYDDVTGYGGRLSKYDIDVQGFRIAYLIEAVFFLYFILQNYEQLGRTKLQVVLLNMALAFCGVLLLFVKSENGGRLSWCFTIAICAILAQLTYKTKAKKDIAVVLIVVCFFLYIRVFNAWQAAGMNLYPYKTFLTDGHRKGDPVWDAYEYDLNYDKNKFYRK